MRIDNDEDVANHFVCDQMSFACDNQANNEKQRLEHKQRAARKAAEEGEAIKPRWFEQVESGKQGEELIFKYKGGYWSSRDSKTYEGCRDIFGQ